MRAEPPGGEEGAFEVDAEDRRSVLELGHLAERRQKLLLGRRDERREVGGDAGLKQRVAGTPVAVRIGFEKVYAAEAVHLEIDEARRGDSAPFPSPDAIAGDPAVDDLDVARNEPPPDDRSFDAEPHPRNTSRTLPPAASSRAAASAAPTPASSETIATFAFPSAAASAASISSAGAPVAVSTIRRMRARSFSLLARTSTIRLSKVFPSRIIEIVEIAFSTSFCAVPALRRVDPARTSGPTTTATSCSAIPASPDSRTATTHAVSAPASAAARTAPMTYGLRPLALIPTTASASPTARDAMSRAPAS